MSKVIIKDIHDISITIKVEDDMAKKAVEKFDIANATPISAFDFLRKLKEAIKNGV